MTAPLVTLHPAAVAAGLAGIGLAALGLLAGRVDIAVLGTPFVLLAVLALARPSRDQPQLDITDDLTVNLTGLAGQVILCRLTSPGHRGQSLLISGDQADFALLSHSQRTGPRPPVRLDWQAQSRLLTRSGPVETTMAPDAVVLPSYQPLAAVPQSSRVRGLTGPRDSPRPGDGLSFRDVHPMAAGETRRRIDWRVTARQARDDVVWVRGSYATGETVAMLVMDSRDEVGPDLNDWRGLSPLRIDEPTSLDLARHAAASVAHALIDAGARVGLCDLATNRRLVVPAAGRHQLRRLTYALALSHAIGSPKTRLRPPQIPRDAIVYLFSTLLDDQSVGLVTMLAQAHQVVVIDTLPDVRPVAEIHLELAWRVTQLERAARLAKLGAQHVPVVRWSGPARAGARQRFLALDRANRRRRP